MTTTEAPLTGLDGSLAAFVEDFGPRWADAWNSHDQERVLSLMTEDVVYDDSAWPTTMRGHAEVRPFLEYTWRAFPDLRFELADPPFLGQDATQATYHWRGTCTHSGPLDPPGLAPTGRQVEFEGFDLHVYRDGRVSRLLIVFDLADFMRQLGLLPASGSRAERAAASLQRLVARLPGTR
jgi:steroid delta-isomerase-like uncharacterized protein